MDKLGESLEKLRLKLKENKDLSPDEWNDYAQKHSYYSSVILQTHLKINGWEAVKEEVFVDDNERSITRRIERARRKLHKSVEETGLSSYRTIELAKQIDILMNRYYKDNRDERKGRFYDEGNLMDATYNKSYEHLKTWIMIEEFPSTKVWNHYAQENDCLNSQSIQFISGMNWHKLRDKIKNHTTFQKYEKYQKI